MQVFPKSSASNNSVIAINKSCNKSTLIHQATYGDVKTLGSEDLPVRIRQNPVNFAPYLPFVQVKWLPVKLRSERPNTEQQVLKSATSYKDTGSPLCLPA